MLSQCPSIVTFNVGFACSLATASSRILSASGRRLKRSKSKCTSSNMIATRRTTGIVMVLTAVPPRPSLAVAVTGTFPSTFGAVKTVLAPVWLLNVPCGADQVMVTGSPSGSVAVTLRLVVPPGSTVGGFAVIGPMVGGRFGAAATATGGGVTVLVT